jgi:hypothetical protein
MNTRGQSALTLDGMFGRSVAFRGRAARGESRNFSQGLPYLTSLQVLIDYDIRANWYQFGGESD